MSEQETYFCDFCGMEYADEDMAKKCSDWCEKHGTCNIEIVRFAIVDDEDYEEE